MSKSDLGVPDVVVCRGHEPEHGDGPNMRKVLFIFGQLTDTDVEWLASQGKRERLPAGSLLIREGVPVETLYVVLEGEVVVRNDKSGRVVANVGAGEIVGEMSFIDARPPSATVCARTDVVVFAVSKWKLQAALDQNVAFAARFYRAVATLLSDRVRRAAAAELGTPADEADELDDSVLDNLDRAGMRFDMLSRTLLHE
jgi:CRP/FNR family cyclic AMP-dependent transcriptional regulator